MSDQSRSRVSRVVIRIMIDPRVRTGVVIAVTIAATVLVGVEILEEMQAAAEQCGPNCEVLG